MRRTSLHFTFPSILLYCAVSAWGERIEETFLSLSTADVSALRSGSYRQAIGELRKKKSDPDPAARLFKLAFAYACSGDTGKALSHYLRAATADYALAPLAWEAIGDIVANKKKIDSALACYDRALTAGVPSAYRTKLFQKIRSIIEDDTAKISIVSLRGEYAQWLSARLPRSVDPFVGRIDSLIGAGLWRSIDSLIDSAFTALDGGIRCAVVKSIDRGRPPPDCGLCAEHLFLLAGSAMDCRQIEAAARLLAAAQQQRDFGAKVSGKALLRFRGKLLFLQRNYTEAITTLKKFVKTYKRESDVLLLIARAYHSLDMLDKAAVWYDRYLALTPRSRKQPEYLWRRAWIEEKQNRPASARLFFRKIYQSYSWSNRADESWIRHALSYYRVERYDSALLSLAAFEAKSGESPLVPAARFWSAKCYLSLNKYANAKAMFDSVARGEPYKYYAHRARDYLSLLGDSAARVSFDTSFNSELTMRWLDSIAPQKNTLSPRDSLNFRRGLILTAIGAPDAALFLASVEESYPENLALAFKIAMLYRFANATYRAANTGRRFSWRIPAENRASITLPIYSLMYPYFFKDIIAAEAKRWNVDPNFAYAVIRQESIFNPDIVSPAGAIGLMQIMPATGKAIAQDLNEPFCVDSLYRPSTSIRYGIYYLRKLLDEFGDNEVLALASYNGGPHNAKEWYRRNKEKDLDLFVEDIDFSETRDYVKKVMANFWVYQNLSRIDAYLTAQ